MKLYNAPWIDYWGALITQAKPGSYTYVFLTTNKDALGSQCVCMFVCVSMCDSPGQVAALECNT